MFLKAPWEVKARMLCHCLENWPRRFLKRYNFKYHVFSKSMCKAQIVCLYVVSWKIRKNFIMKEYWGFMFCKLRVWRTAFTFQSKEKQNSKKMFFKRLCLRQQNTVIIERQEVNKMNLCGFSFLLGRRNKLEMANSLSWGNWPVNSQKRILESTELHKEF